MLWQTILFGCILGFIITKLQELSSKRQRHSSKPPTTTPEYSCTYNPWGWVTLLNPPSYHPIEFSRERVTRRRMFYVRPLELFRIQQTRKRSARILVENWRKSIAGLVRLADKNLEFARERMESRDCKAAVQAASTSVENIARALIHCYGGKPDLGSGQEEALRMLSRKFKGDEKSEFERAIDTVVCISHNKTVLKHFSARNLQIRLFDEEKTKQILESASKIIRLFKRIITDNFVEEISELRAQEF